MPERSAGNLILWLFDSREGIQGRLLPRWIFLRALAAIYFSAFYSLLFQIKGLIGPEGIFPAQDYLAAVARAISSTNAMVRADAVLVGSSSHALMLVTWIGLIASIVAFLNLWPRLQLLHLLCLFSLLCFSGGRILKLPIGRNAAGSRIHCALLHAARPDARTRARLSSVAREPVSAAVGVVPHLFRIRHRQARQRRSAVAHPHRDGRVLPERPAAHLDRMVRRASAALVSCGQRCRHTGAGTCDRVDAFSSSPRAHTLFLHRDAVGDRRDSHRQLHVPQLPGAVAGISVAG